MCCAAKERFPQVDWWLHFHNTRGLGLANVMAGMEAGLTQFDSSIAGLGGCPFVPGAAGNISTEDLVNLCDEVGIETGIDLGKMMEVGKRMEAVVGHPGTSYLLRAGRPSDLIRELPKGQAKNHTTDNSTKK